MHRLRTIVALVIFASLSPIAQAEDPPSPQELCDAVDAGELTTMQFEAAEQVLEADIDYRAILCSTAGAIYIDLYEELTPMTVNNFVFLAEQGYYDNTTFHRVIPDFMAQGGDPTGSGRGGPGYQFGDEPVSYLTFDRPGLLAMANAGPGTNGSQFFITTALTPHLNYKHTIFGDVLVGQDMVEAIQERDPSTANEPGEALQAVLIITDHSQVDNSEVVELEPATQEEVVAAFEAFGSSLPPSLPINDKSSGLSSTTAIAEFITSDRREAYETYAATYGHQYRYRVDIENAGCESAIYFTSLAYQVDVFESAAAAGRALSDPVTSELLEADGYRRDDDMSNSFSRQIPTCAGDEGVQAVSLYTYGRFLVSIDVLVAGSVLDQAGVSGAAVLADLARQIEPGFAALYLPEIR